MNLQGCEDYLVKMHFHISAVDIEKYNEAFSACCEKLRARGEIISQDEYTDEQLLAYTLRVMDVLRGQQDAMVRKLDYLVSEGFVTMHSDGCVYPSELKFDHITEGDFGESRAA